MKINFLEKYSANLIGLSKSTVTVDRQDSPLADPKLPVGDDSGLRLDAPADTDPILNFQTLAIARKQIEFSLGRRVGVTGSTQLLLVTCGPAEDADPSEGDGFVVWTLVK